MQEVVESQPKTLTRRDRFREYMKRLNPTASARDAITAGLVVADLHQSLYQHLAARADLEPGSQQLIAGGVGSGKTTQLLLAADWLRGEGRSIPLYVDVAKVTNLVEFEPGAVLAAFGLQLAEMCSEHPRLATSSEALEVIERCDGAIREFAHGKGITISEKLLEQPSARPVFWRPGVLRHAPPVELPKDFFEAGGSIEQLLKTLRNESLEVVAFLDGLDRLTAAATFWRAVELDFIVLRAFQVSVVTAAPITVLFELGRTIPERFDQVHHLLPLIAEPEAGGVLRSVLERRGATELLQPPAVDLICSASGGVLRDLLSLARDAGEEAYISGADRTGGKHAAKVVRQLGTAYLRGLGPGEIKALAELARTGSFDPHAGVNAGLLATRRVLEYSPTGFRVHPALLPLIREAEARIA